MTSSLVGSEMCIRDSINAVGAMVLPPRRGQQGHRTASVWALYPHGTVLQLLCLLYTSDAADDMQ
eukprot:7622194-Prorocentrum_lima.AAC.1